MRKSLLHSAWGLFYDEFAWLFDFVSWCISLGKWKAWCYTSIYYLQHKRVLELGHGPGHLLISLKKAGYQPVGIDLSPGMGRQAARRLRRAGVDVPLVCCRAQALPFRDSSFDETVATFPTDDILELNTLREVARVMPKGGRLVMVVGAQRKGSQPDPHFVDWIKGLVGQNGIGSGRTASFFCRAGLRASIDYQSVGGSPAILVIAEKHPRWDGWVNTLPTVDAGPVIIILSKDCSDHILNGTATDADGDPLTYRWLKEQTVLSHWKAVEADGKAFLELQTVSPLPVGQHSLILEVSDSYETVRDTMILTIENSPPTVRPIGEGSYEVNTPVILGGQVSDYDGDLLNYWWLEGETVLTSGSIQTVQLGNPINLTTFEISNLNLGTHTLTLQVNDGVNRPVSANVRVIIIDSTPPRLAPVANKILLWPPDHSMVNILINANAHDNSGLPVMLSASVSSNEPETGLEDEDIGPDWSIPSIDQAQGTIALQLRAERSGRGQGRQYTVTITATDQSGNASAANIKILVPYNQGGDDN